MTYHLGALIGLLMTHSQPILPVNPNRNPVPAVQYGLALHYTATLYYMRVRKVHPPPPTCKTSFMNGPLQQSINTQAQPDTLNVYLEYTTF